MLGLLLAACARELRLLQPGSCGARVLSPSFLQPYARGHCSSSPHGHRGADCAPLFRQTARILAMQPESVGMRPTAFSYWRLLVWLRKPGITGESTGGQGQRSRHTSKQRMHAKGHRGSTQGGLHCERQVPAPAAPTKPGTPSFRFRSFGPPVGRDTMHTGARRCEGEVWSTWTKRLWWGSVCRGVTVPAGPSHALMLLMSPSPRAQYSGTCTTTAPLCQRRGCGRVDVTGSGTPRADHSNILRAITFYISPVPEARRRQKREYYHGLYHELVAVCAGGEERSPPGTRQHAGRRPTGGTSAPERTSPGRPGVLTSPGC